MNRNRLLGFAYLLKAFTPLIVILLIAGTAIHIVNQVNRTLATPLGLLSDSVDQLQNNARAVGTEMQNVSQNLVKVGETMKQFPDVAKLVPEIPESIDIPEIDVPDIKVPVPTASMGSKEVNLGLGKVDIPTLSIGSEDKNIKVPNIPKVNVPVPGLAKLDEEFGDAFEPVSSAFKNINTEFGNVSAKMGTLKTEVEKAADSAKQIPVQGQALLSSARDLIATLRRTVMIGLVILVLLAANWFIIPAIRDFQQGMALIRGVPAPTPESQA